MLTLLELVEFVYCVHCAWSLGKWRKLLFGPFGWCNLQAFCFSRLRQAKRVFQTAKCGTSSMFMMFLQRWGWPCPWNPWTFVNLSKASTFRNLKKAGTEERRQAIRLGHLHCRRSASRAAREFWWSSGSDGISFQAVQRKCVKEHPSSPIRCSCLVLFELEKLQMRVRYASIAMLRW